MGQALLMIDRAENLSVPQETEGVWFVRDMARQVYKNMGHMTSLLKGFEAKLALLTHAMECPVCLEPFGEVGRGPFLSPPPLLMTWMMIIVRAVKWPVRLVHIGEVEICHIITLALLWLS